MQVSTGVAPALLAIPRNSRSDLAIQLTAPFLAKPLRSASTIRSVTQTRKSLRTYLLVGFRLLSDPSASRNGRWRPRLRGGFWFIRSIPRRPAGAHLAGVLRMDKDTSHPFEKLGAIGALRHNRSGLTSGTATTLRTLPASWGASIIQDSFLVSMPFAYKTINFSKIFFCCDSRHHLLDHRWQSRVQTLEIHDGSVAENEIHRVGSHRAAPFAFI